jgi:hypothetical protein
MTERTPKGSIDDDREWTTVSYRTIYSIVAAVVLVVGGALLWRYWPAAAPSAPAADAPQMITARFTALEGSVKVRPFGKIEWLSADAAMVLHKGDMVRTGAGTTAEVTFFDGTVVHVRPESLIKIEEAFEDPATRRRKVAWHINSGEVNFKTAERRGASSGSAEISTPTVRVTQGEAATGGIRVDEATGEANLRQFSGRGQAETTAGEKIELSDNEAVKVDKAGKAGPKIVLPAAPELLAPPHQAEIQYGDPARSTTALVWKAVDGAVGYNVMLDYSPFFNRPVVDQRGVRGTSVDLRGLEAGKYYWRVSAVDAAGSEGPFSNFGRFAVARSAVAAGGPPPPLALDGLDVRGSILQIKGRTEPGATVTVNGQRVDVQNDGSFNEFVTLADQPGAQSVVVRATGVAGGVREVRRSVEVK